MLPKGEAVKLSSAQVDDLRAFAVDCAREAGLEALHFFRKPALASQDKGGESWFNPVTAADQRAEAAVRRRIAAHFPEHGVFGEEQGYQAGASPLTWVIDPIDGTKAFMSGMLHWGVLIALYDGVEPVIGVLHQPFTNEFFVGVPGAADYRHGNVRSPLKVRACEHLSKATLATTGTDYFSADAYARFERVRAKVLMRRFGGDCYSYAMLAHGQLDLVLEWDLKPYDVQALIPIVRGAGGVLTDWQGNDASLGGSVLAAGDPRLAEAVMRLLSD